MEAGSQRLQLWETEESNVTKPKPFFHSLLEKQVSYKMADEDPPTNQLTH